MNNDKIEVGDIVSVDINVAQITLMREAKVLNVPQATGEPWHFKCTSDGCIVYTSEPITVKLIEKGSEIECPK